MAKPGFDGRWLHLLAALQCLWAGVSPVPVSAQIWSRAFDGTANYRDQVNAIAFDGTGDVLAAGVLYNDPPAGHFAVVKFNGTTGAELWRNVPLGAGPPGAGSIVVDGADDVIAGGYLSGFTVIKMSGATGAEQWRYTTSGSYVWSIALDAAGDVVAAGAGAGFEVVKLNGMTGAELWRTGYGAPSSNVGYAVALDAAGHVVVAGVLDVFHLPVFSVVKVNGSTGAQLWRKDVGSGTAYALALDASGNAVAAGRLPPDAVIKLAAADGAELWRAALDSVESPGQANAVAVDAAGDVIAAGVTDPAYDCCDFAVKKMNGATGATLWSRAVDGTELGGPEEALALALDAASDVIAAGQLANAQSGFDFAVVKLDGITGGDIWRRELDGSIGGQAFERALAVAVDGTGAVAAGGHLVYDVTGLDFTVAKFDAATGGDVLPLGGYLQVKDRAATPSARLVFLKANDLLLRAIVPGTPGDPTSDDGTLALTNPGSGETVTLALPAANWRPLGTPPGSKGFRYVAGSPADPCRTVLLRGTRLTARCRGDQIGFSLDEPTQGTLGVRLTLGSGALRYCFLFGGTIRRDTPATGDQVGYFQAVDAPRADVCP